MSGNRVGGTIALQIQGEVYDAKGNFTFNLGRPKRDAVIGANRVHGFKETQQPAFIEGEITDANELSLTKLVGLDGVTVTLSLSNGKVIILRDAWYAAEGTGNTDEGNFQVKFEAITGEEVTD